MKIASIGKWRHSGWRVLLALFMGSVCAAGGRAHNQTSPPEFSVVGQNLLSPNHMEAPSEPDWFAAAAVRRSYYGKMTWHFQGTAKK